MKLSKFIILVFVFIHIPKLRGDGGGGSKETKNLPKLRGDGGGGSKETKNPKSEYQLKLETYKKSFFLSLKANKILQKKIRLKTNASKKDLQRYLKESLEIVKKKLKALINIEKDLKTILDDKSSSTEKEKAKYQYNRRAVEIKSLTERFVRAKKIFLGKTCRTNITYKLGDNNKFLATDQTIYPGIEKFSGIVREGKASYERCCMERRRETYCSDVVEGGYPDPKNQAYHSYVKNFANPMDLYRGASGEKCEGTLKKSNGDLGLGYYYFADKKVAENWVINGELSRIHDDLEKQRESKDDEELVVDELKVLCLINMPVHKQPSKVVELRRDGRIGKNHENDSGWQLHGDLNQLIQSHPNIFYMQKMRGQGVEEYFIPNRGDPIVSKFDLQSKIDYIKEKLCIEKQWERSLKNLIWVKITNDQDKEPFYNKEFCD